MLHKKIKLIVILLLSIGLARLQAQEVVPSTGGNASGSGGTVSYTIGQVVYTPNTGTSGSVTQGIQQPYEISIINGIDESDGINLSYTVYPNPTADFLFLKIVGEIKMLCIAYLYDANGKLLESKRIVGNETVISMKNKLPTIYFLKVTYDNKEIKTFKIIKK